MLVVKYTLPVISEPYKFHGSLVWDENKIAITTDREEWREETGKSVFILLYNAHILKEITESPNG
jgi:hypothetical protein